MKIHYLQHVDFETPDTLLDWAEERGHGLSATRLFAGERLPGLQDIDLLVIMGGPMSVNDENQYPWLAGEKSFIREAVEQGCRVLGICLGAQLLASALGAKVNANPQKEIGWFPVSLTPEGKQSRVFYGFEPVFTTFQWHGDTFDLPQGTTLLATGEVCANQAFQFGEHAFGLQFHMEVSQKGVKGLIEHGGDELVSAPFIQTAEQMLQSGEYEENRENLFRFMDELSR